MAKQRYIVMPGILFVGGAPVPLDRRVSLTPEEAAYDLGLGRIYLDGTQPPPVLPAEPVKAADVLVLTRDGISQPVTAEQLAAFIGSGGRLTLALSSITFPTGVAQGAILAAITAPIGWDVTAETTFGGRIGVSPDGKNLVAAQAISAAASGTARLRASSPDRLRSVVETFPLTFEAPADVTAPTILTAASFTTLENTALVVQLLASEPVVWTKTGGADAALWTLDTNAVPPTITLAARNFEDPKDDGADNTYAVQVTATDPSGNATPKTITGTVTNVVEGVRATLAPVDITFASTAAAGTVLADWPAKAEAETRTVDVSWLAVNTAGKLVVGAGALPSGASLTAKVTQAARKAGEVAIVTDLAITISDRVPTNRVAEISTISGARTAEVSQAIIDRITVEQNDTTNTHPALGPYTHVAVKDGDWFDPTTWATGTVPGDGASVNVGAFNVSHGQASTAKIKEIHVGGRGKLRRLAGSLLWLTTLMAHGAYTVGDASAAIPDASKVQTILHNRGGEAPGATVKFGINLMGPSRHYGEDKQEVRSAIGSLAAGATQIDIGNAGAANWRIGDEICVIGTQNAGTTATDATYKGPTQFYGNSDTSGTPRLFTQTKGFHLSRDEVRKITAITGNVVTLDAPLDYAHDHVTASLPRGDVVIVPVYVLNFSRSIEYKVDPALDLTVLQNRPHFMQMHDDDQQMRCVDIKDFGRTSNDPSLVIADTADGFWSMPLRASNGGALIADPNNVRGRYGLHSHSSGAEFGRRPHAYYKVVVRGQSPAAGLTAVQALNTAIPVPGLGFVIHDSRVNAERCISYNCRGAGWMTELGNETGQLLDNWSVWNRGDGYEAFWGYRAEYAQNHNGHMGAGFENQSRQMLQIGNRAASSHIAWIYFQQNERAGALTKTILRRSPKDTALRFRDPFTQGGNLGDGQSIYQTEDVNLYGIEQAQIPDFDDNLTLCCDDGFFVSHRQFLDRTDVMPMVARRNHCIKTKTPFRLVNYSFNYIFLDALWDGPGGTTACTLGSITWGQSFANILLRNYSTGFFDDGNSINYNGMFSDIAFENVVQPFVNATYTIANPSAHPLFEAMGPWTGTAPNMKVRNYKSFSTSSEADLAEARALPKAPRGSGGKLIDGSTPDYTRGPYFVWAADIVTTVTPNGKQAILRGDVVDKLGVRRWPDWQTSEMADPVGTHSGGVWNGVRAHDNMTGTQLVERNGCFNDGGTWKSRLWFVDADRATGEWIVWSVDITLSGFDAPFLAKHTVDPVATKPALPLKPEVLRDTAIVADTTKPVILSAASVSVAEGQRLALTLRANKAPVRWALAGADATKFQVAIVAGMPTLQFASDGVMDFEAPTDAGGNNVYDVAITATDAAGNASDPQPFAATITDVLESVTTFSDAFTGNDGDLVADRPGFEYLEGGGDRGALRIKSNQLAVLNTSSLPSVYRQPSFTSRNQAIEFLFANGAGGSNVSLNLRYTDNNNRLVLRRNNALSTLDVTKVVGGVSTVVARLSNPATSLVRAELDANLLTVRYGGTVQGSAIDIGGDLPDVPYMAILAAGSITTEAIAGDSFRGDRIADAGATAPVTSPVPVVGSSLNGMTITQGASPYAGGSPITGYDIRYSKDAGSTWTEVLNVGFPLTVSGLTTGDSYLVQKRAKNAVGVGNWSASADLRIGYGGSVVGLWRSSPLTDPVFGLTISTDGRTVRRPSNIADYDAYANHRSPNGYLLTDGAIDRTVKFTVNQINTAKEDMVGLTTSSFGTSSSFYTAANIFSVMLGTNVGKLLVNGAVISAQIATAIAVGDVVEIKIKSGKMYARVNTGNWNGDASANPDTGVGGVTAPAQTVAPTFGSQRPDFGVTADFSGWR